MAPLRVSAAVLIGGHSRRMGTPKALIRLRDDGDTLIERVVATLRTVAADIMLVGGPCWPVPAALDDCRHIVDRGMSAADGIVAALDGASARFCVIVACDMPFLDGALLREMAISAARRDGGVVATDARGWHPLHAVWDRERLPELRAAVERGQRSLGVLARMSGMIPVDLDAPERAERARWSVFNVNTPADLALAREHAEDGA